MLVACLLRVLLNYTLSMIYAANSFSLLFKIEILCTVLISFHLLSFTFYLLNDKNLLKNIAVIFHLHNIEYLNDYQELSYKFLLCGYSNLGCNL